MVQAKTEPNIFFFMMIILATGVNYLSVFLATFFAPLLRSYGFMCVFGFRCDEQAIHEYGKRRLSTSFSHSSSGDGVLLTEADMEGYSSSPNHDNTRKDLETVPKVSSRWSIIPQLSCLFASPRDSGGYRPVTKRLPMAEAHAS